MARTTRALKLRWRAASPTRRHLPRTWRFRARAARLMLRSACSAASLIAWWPGHSTAFCTWRYGQTHRLWTQTPCHGWWHSAGISTWRCSFQAFFSSGFLGAIHITLLSVHFTHLRALLTCMSSCLLWPNHGGQDGRTGWRRRDQARWGGRHGAGGRGRAAFTLLPLNSHMGASTTWEGTMHEKLGRTGNAIPASVLWHFAAARRTFTYDSFLFKHDILPDMLA